MKNIVSTLFFSFIFASASLFSSYTIVEDQMDEKIKSPSLQNIETKKIKLDNGLEAFIVSDPQAKKSGVSLAVGVGTNHEPKETVGLAHFVEHMLFMGTEKYPNENEHHEFIAQRGGFDNAYTASDRTVYTFQINNEHALEAIDRFSSFFISPLFYESGLARERQAVNEERLNRINNDQIRLWMVAAKTLNPDLNVFTERCGSLESLEQISRDELVNWYQNNYSANIMKLAVYSSVPLNQLIKHVDECFSQVPNKNLEPMTLQGRLANPDFLAKTVYVEPIRDEKTLWVMWELPSQFGSDLDTHTGDLVGQALGEESQRSLATRLKEDGYIVGLDCGVITEDKEHAFFIMSYELTDKGLHERQAVLEQTYAAIRALEKNGIARYRFDEMTALAKMDYQFQSRPEAYNFVSSVSKQLLYEDLATFPKKSLWPTQYDPHQTQTFLKALQPKNACTFVMAPSKLTQKQCPFQEKFSEALYGVEEINPQALARWEEVDLSHRFALAPPNPYIPSHLELVTSASDYQDHRAPQLVCQSEKTEIYYMADQEFQVPEASYTLFLQTPSFAPSALNDVLMDLYSFSLYEKLSNHLEQGSLAGFDVKLKKSPKFGLQIGASGYSQKAQQFLSAILQEAKNHQPEAKNFERYKNFLMRQYSNEAQATPYIHSEQTMKAIVMKDYQTPEARLEAIAGVNYQQLKTYCESLFDTVYIRGMIYGNVNTRQSQQFVTNLEAAFEDSQTYSLNNHYPLRVLDLSAASTPRYFAQSSTQLGSSTRLMVSYGKLQGKERAAYEVMSKAIKTPFFDRLRTQQQVGYIVAALPNEREQECYTHFIAQSNSCSTRDMLARFELFNEEFLASIGTDTLSEPQFETIKAALIDNYSQPTVSIGAKGMELTKLAFVHKDFELKEKRIEALKNLSFDEFAAFCYEKIGKNNPQRIAVFIDGDMTSSPMLHYEPIHNLSHFKAESCYPESICLPKVASE